MSTVRLSFSEVVLVALLTVLVVLASIGIASLITPMNVFPEGWRCTKSVVVDGRVTCTVYEKE